MASERVSVELIANDHDEFIFHVHQRMCRGNRRYDYSQIKQNYHLLKALPSNQDLKYVKVVIGHDNFHLLLPTDYRKGRKNEP